MTTLQSYIAALEAIARGATDRKLFAEQGAGDPGDPAWYIYDERERLRPATHRQEAFIVMSDATETPEAEARFVAAFSPRTALRLLEVVKQAETVRNWMVTMGHCNGDSHWQYRGLDEALGALGEGE